MNRPCVTVIVVVVFAADDVMRRVSGLSVVLERSLS